MSDLVPAGSPFDRIKQTRPDGSEYWSARSLQSLMGYARWENMREAVARAQQATSNTGADVGEHFRDATKAPSSGGTPREDLELTRYAAYLTAMNGDPRKQEVADAQSYFAVRTREAEAAAAKPMTELEMARKYVAALEQVAALAPAANSWTQLAEAAGDYSLREAAQILDRDPAISTGQNRLSKYLRQISWTDRTGQPYQAQVDTGRLVVRTRDFFNSGVGEQQVTTQLRITVKGLQKLHELLGGSGPLLLAA